LADAAKCRRRGSAEPDVERLDRPRFDIGGADREIVARERDILLLQNRSQQLQRFIEDGGPLSVGHHEDFAFRGNRRPQAEHRKHPLGCQAGQRRQLFGHQHRMTAGKHRDGRADLQICRPGQRVGHPNEGIDRLRIHQLGEPQRIDTRFLEMVDDARQLLGTGICTQPDAEPNLHVHLQAPSPMLRKPAPGALCAGVQRARVKK